MSRPRRISPRMKVVLFLFGMLIAAVVAPFGRRRDSGSPPADWKANANALLAPGRRVMAVCAHPDDLEFYAGGTLARLHDEGVPVRVILGTDGNKSRYLPAGWAASMGRRRREEQLAAARILGYDKVVFLGHPDGHLAEARSVPEGIAQHLREFRPDTVLTFDSQNLWGIQHPDHRAAGEFALQAIRLAGIHPEVFLFATSRPNTWVDVSGTIDRKWEALRAHRSQFGPIRFWLVHSRLLGPMAEAEGMKIGARDAETFRRLPQEGAGG